MVVGGGQEGEGRKEELEILRFCMNPRMNPRMSFTCRALQA